MIDNVRALALYRRTPHGMPSSEIERGLECRIALLSFVILIISDQVRDLPKTYLWNFYNTQPTEDENISGTDKTDKS